MKKGDLFFNILRVPTDMIMLVLAGVLTYILRTKILVSFRPVLFEFNLPISRYVYLVSAVSAVFILSYAVSGLYQVSRRMSVWEEMLKVLLASSAGIMAVIVFIFLRAELFSSRFLVLGGWILAVALVFAGRLTIRKIQSLMARYFDFGIHKVMLIGDDEVTEKIARSLDKDFFPAYKIVKRMTGNPEVGEIRASAGNPGVDEIILANPNYPAKEITKLVDFCNEQHIAFNFVPNIYEILTANFEVEIVGNIPVIQLKRTALDGWGRVFKRMVDVVSALTGLILLLPFLTAIAFAIKWETAGPVLVRVRRISKNKEFSLFKFRSMVENAEELKPLLAAMNQRSDGPLFKIKDDPRVTGVGGIIRRLRLDELPQLWNVMKGDISLVGPRPHQPDEIAQYARHHKKVLAIKAGATGLAQVSGSSDLAFEDEVALDTYYVEKWSLWLDTKIILKTFWLMFTDRSAV